VQIFDVKKTFGASVKAWRNRRGISQEELGERSDLHRTYISDVERGARNLSLESITRLARALDISVTAFFPAEFNKREESDGGGHNGHGRSFVNILMVEDDAQDEEMARHAFQKARFENRITVVRDGAEALDYLFCRGSYASRPAEDNPQVILLDLNLPKVSGLEVLLRIKADKKTRAIPVVVLTVSQKGPDIAECRRLGVETYIMKPVDFQGLSRVTPLLNLNWALLKPALSLQA
jgi:CheY-like chemotaxis protein